MTKKLIKTNDGRSGAETWGGALRQVVRAYAESLIVAVLVAVILRFFVVAAYRIPTESMLPALQAGDFILGYKLPFGFSVPFTTGARKVAASLPERGEVVIFRCPHELESRCVKRVVGLPGDRIEIRNHRLFINGESAEYVPPDRTFASDVPGVPLVEKWRQESRLIFMGRGRGDGRDFGPVVIPPDYFFVLNDNRSLPMDSRSWGAVPVNYLEARAWLVWMSFDWQRISAEEWLPQIRWERVFEAVR